MDDTIMKMTMIADAPEEQRRPMMKARIETLVSKPKDQRLTDMGEMVTVGARMNDGRRKKMIRARNFAIAELPDDQRSKIMATRIALAKTLPGEIHKLDMKIMIEAIFEMTADFQTRFRQTLKEQLQAAHMSMLDVL